MAYNSIRRRIGNAVVAALQSGDTVLDGLLAGAGATLNVELSWFPNDTAEMDRQPGYCRVMYDGVERVPFAEGEMRAFKRRTYVFKLMFALWDDVGKDQPALDLSQGLERVFGDSREFFRDFVNNTEANLPALAGRVELDEDIIEAESNSRGTVEATVRITVMQKKALTQ